MKPIKISKIENKLNEIESYIKNLETKKVKISKVTIGWHLDHSLKVVNGVINTLKTSDISLYESNFTFLGKVFFMIGHFPKGRAKAPKRVMPPEIILKEDIIAQLQLAFDNIQEVSNLNDNSYFTHPIFGNINKTRVIRFLEIHTNHHLKIVKSILK